MIDLHMHTNCSDGSDSTLELLKKASLKGLDIISITDHDSCEAYIQLESLDNPFKGKIINGIEITTSFLGYRIEVLAYNFKDYKKVHDKFSSIKNLNWDDIYTNCRLELLSRIKKLGLSYDDYFEKNLLIRQYETKLYKSLEDNNSNLKEVLKDEYCERASLFFRKCVSNPDSYFYLDYSTYNHDLNDLLDFMKKEGALVFLAHPFSYGFSDVDAFISRLYDEMKLDGIEVYHSYVSKEEIEYLNEFAFKRNLLRCGGTDYHGDFRPELELGFLFKSKLKVDSEILKDWI